ncbi:endonuclease/exonuclease/phosphatase family protein [Toxoplasma gondii ME49]|uniref:Endonuclease/exonuclease/phosphatase family protein n=1 Tax=Toxoplasma gondii (strain ATCC 50611 / Me49) TaxID=508771 RepID=S8FA35_TOXGM|nr:endonuclease/exonuclease/phosphatase family protein [Toxoplasma gondii ME49]EPT30488.1 endonuclease/exonuclease/phosphatase family protein [Toxoplasma gondii ME49]|eukprot:XP_002366858.2 endonuclease/exonuclease/phosphatase family protein [Toxoplasma gondii ME49]
MQAHTATFDEFTCSHRHYVNRIRRDILGRGVLKVTLHEALHVDEILSLPRPMFLTSFSSPFFSGVLLCSLHLPLLGASLPLCPVCAPPRSSSQLLSFCSSRLLRASSSPGCVGGRPGRRSAPVAKTKPVFEFPPLTSASVPSLPFSSPSASSGKPIPRTVSSRSSPFCPAPLCRFFSSLPFAHPSSACVAPSVRSGSSLRPATFLLWSFCFSSRLAVRSRKCTVHCQLPLSLVPTVSLPGLSLVQSSRRPLCPFSVSPSAASFCLREYSSLSQRLFTSDSPKTFFHQLPRSSSNGSLIYSSLPSSASALLSSSPSPSSSPSSASSPSSSAVSGVRGGTQATLASCPSSFRKSENMERRSKLGDLLVTRAADGKLLLTFFWLGQRVNLERSEEEPLDRLLQRLRLSCRKVTQKRLAEETRKGKAARKQRKKAEESSPGAHAATEPVHNEEKKAAAIEDLPFIFLRRKDGTVAPGDEACGVSFQRASLICFSPFAPQGDAERTGKSELSPRDESADSENVLEVVWDPPVARCIYVPQAVYTGCPVLACVVTEHANEDDLVIEWRYEDSGVDGPVIHRGRHYTPKPADEGRVLILKAYHPLYSVFSVTNSLPPVLPCPSIDWHFERNNAFSPSSPSSLPSLSPAASSSVPSHPSVRAKSSKSLRVCSFNILAGAYARTPHAVQAMYPYCSGHHLDLHHRKALLGKELHALDGDIVALQECSSSLFFSFLAPLFKEEYHAFLQCKFKARVQEGCALLIRKKYFSVLREGSVIFQKELLTNPQYDELLAELRRKWPHFETDVLPHLTTVMQFAILRRRDTREAHDEKDLPKTLVVANTHLFFHPYARHIRVLQIYVMTNFLQTLREEFAESEDSSTAPAEPASFSASRRLPPVIMCGDFNCQPGSGGLKLLKKKAVHAYLDDWHDGLAFRWEKDEDAAAEDEEEKNGDEEAKSGIEMKKEDAPGTIVSPSLPETSPASSDSAVAFAAASESRNAEHEGKGPHEMESGIDHREAGGEQGTGEEPGVALRLPGDLDLVDCYEDSPLAFSNFVSGFQATLDYIYASSDFKVVARLPGVSEEAVRAHGGLPCHGYPSDHLAIAVDLQLKSTESPENSYTK